MVALAGAVSPAAASLLFKSGFKNGFNGRFDMK
jgi:hypothetical protein